MKVTLSSANMRAIEAHLESTYPNEGAGFLLGRNEGGCLNIQALLPIENKWEAEEQYHRYVLTTEDFMRAELEATKRGLDMVGVFHSHPDHPAEPSIFDRDHAMPNFSYLITTVARGSAEVTHAWRLREDRTAFDSEPLEVV